MADPTPDLSAVVARVTTVSACDMGPLVCAWGDCEVMPADLRALLSALSRLESERDAQVDATLALQAELAAAKAAARAAEEERQ